VSKEPSPEDYRLLIEREWADIHHSRVQEWTALGVVTGAHIGILQLIRLLHQANTAFSFSTIAIIGSFTAALFAIFGVLMTCRHRHLMKIKLGWIYTAEEHLGLVHTAKNTKGIIPENAEIKVSREWKRLALPRPLSTSWLILCFYILLLLIDVLSLVAFMRVG